MDIQSLQKKLGIRLKELRQAKGLKQEGLEKYRFSYRYYGKLERGLVNPTFDTLIRIANIFEVDLSELFSFMSNENMLSEDAESIAIKIRQLFKENDEKKLRKLKIFIDEIL